MTLDVVLEDHLPHPVEAVWRALTEAESVSEWLMATSDYRPAVGAQFRMKTERLSPSGWVDAEVLEVDAPRRLVWAWSAGDGLPPSTVTFELAEEAGGTLLRLTHRGESDPAVGRLLQDGWPTRIELLRRLL